MNKNAKYDQNSLKTKGIMAENPYSTLAFLIRKGFLAPLTKIPF